VKSHLAKNEMAFFSGIEFENRSNGETIVATITSLHHFPTFKILCEAFSPERYGSKNKDEWQDMYQYYSPEDEQKYGVLGIEIRL